MAVCTRLVGPVPGFTGALRSEAIWVSFLAHGTHDNLHGTQNQEGFRAPRQGESQLGARGTHFEIGIPPVRIMLTGTCKTRATLHNPAGTHLARRAPCGKDHANRSARTLHGAPRALQYPCQLRYVTWHGSCRHGAPRIMSTAELAWILPVRGAPHAIHVPDRARRAGTRLACLRRAPCNAHARPSAPRIMSRGTGFACAHAKPVPALPRRIMLNS